VLFRSLKVIKLATGSGKRAIWIDCGIHAREWISPSTCIYFIDKLIREYNLAESVTTSLLDHYEFHILPVHNPDGYEYTQITRLWRKNRSKNQGSCLGVDLNRNYGFKWMVAGASSNACSDTYAGPSPDSEPETKAVQAAINAKLGNWDAFITVHSYGQWAFTPWGWTTQLPADYTEQMDALTNTASVIKSVYGTTFVSGTTSNLLYLAAGCSNDWAYGSANIKHAYTFELRPGTGTADASFGFVLPESRAPLVGEEMYQGFKALFLTIKQ